MSRTSCYQKLVEKIISNPAYETTAEDWTEFATRGHSFEEMKEWTDAIRWVCKVADSVEGNVNAKKKACQERVSEIKVPFYRLTNEEIETIKDAEWFGAGKEGDILLTYGETVAKNVISRDYRNLPCQEGGRKDILVVFSGHPKSAVWAAEAVYSYIRNHRKLPYGIMFLGLEDNQELTQFNPKFKFRKGSEYRMYLRQMLSLGMPKGLLKKLLMSPYDTSTEGNADLVVDTCNKYDLADEDINLIFISYPVYQLRVASEFSFMLQDRLPRAWVRIAYVWPPLDEMGEQRLFSYEQPQWQLADLSLANCVAHLFREQGKKRFALRSLQKYPEEFKPLAPLFLGYSYPNVVHELCGTDEKTAEILKIIRTLMLDAYDEGGRGDIWDRQMCEDTKQAARRLHNTLQVPVAILRHGYRMEEEEFLRGATRWYR